MRSLQRNSTLISHIQRWGGKSLFFFGIVVYILVHPGLIHLSTMLARQTPVEPDDAYSYILKAPQLQSCFWQDCPALEDLRQQFLIPSPDKQVAWTRDRVYQRTIYLYPPLHSALLLGVHTLGFSWEKAYNILVLCGSLCMGGAIAYWLYSLFGYLVSGIAMILITVTLFEGQGIHGIVPGNLALGIAMITWGIILQAGKYHRWVLPLCVLAMMTMHPIGKVYAVVTLMMYVFLHSPFSWSKKTWFSIGFCLGLIVLAFTLPLLISRPALSFQTTLKLSNVWNEYQTNATAAIHFVRKWTNSYRGNVVTVGTVLLIGLCSLAAEQKRKVLIMGGGLTFLYITSIFHLYPGYSATLVRRIWVPMGIFLTALLGQSLWGLGALAYHQHAQLVLSQKNTPGFHWQRFGRNIVIILIAAVFMRLCQYTFTGYQRTTRFASSLVARTNISLDPAQPALVLSQSQKCPSILYLQETPMYFFLSHGAYQCGAVFYRAVAGTPQEKTWIHDNKQLGYLVGWNPLDTCPVAREGGLEFLPDGYFTLEIPRPQSLNHGELYLDNRGEKTTLTMQFLTTSPSQQRTISLQIPADWSGWITYVSQTSFQASALSLHIADQDGLVLLKGFRNMPGSTLNWPWDQGITLTCQPSKSEPISYTLDFTSASFSPLSDRIVHVIADSGSTILAKIEY